VLAPLFDVSAAASNFRMGQYRQADAHVFLKAALDGRSTRLWAFCTSNFKRVQRRVGAAISHSIWQSDVGAGFGCVRRSARRTDGWTIFRLTRSWSSELLLGLASPAFGRAPGAGGIQDWLGNQVTASPQAKARRVSCAC